MLVNILFHAIKKKFAISIQWLCNIEIRSFIMQKLTYDKECIKSRNL